MSTHLEIPRQYNAARDLLGRNAVNAEKTAFVDAISGEKLTYGELTKQAYQFANALRAQGFQPETRVMLCMLDTPAWPVVFLGCMLAGVVPVATNTLLTTKDFEYMLRDSRAKALIVSSALLAAFEGLIGQLPDLKTTIVSGEIPKSGSYLSLEKLITQADTQTHCEDTCADDVCFWLYSSGSTGSPKGTVHLHSHLIQTAELYGKNVLGIQSQTWCIQLPSCFLRTAWVTHSHFL